MVAGVTNVTIRNRCKVLISMLGLDPTTFDDTRARRKTRSRPAVAVRAAQ